MVAKQPKTRPVFLQSSPLGRGCSLKPTGQKSSVIIWKSVFYG
jgi:hypothetical protein